MRMDVCVRAAIRASAIFLVFSGLVWSPLPAQQAVATTDVNVRAGQSKSSKILDRLHAGDTVALASPAKRAGYYHIQEPGGTVGWVYARYLSVISGGPTSNP